MKRLRLGAVLHFIIAIGHLGCLFALDEAFDAYGIKDVMHNIVFGNVWMLYALTIGLALAFALAGLYALSATGDIRRLPLTRTAIIVIIVLYSLRALAGGALKRQCLEQREPPNLFGWPSRDRQRQSQ